MEEEIIIEKIKGEARKYFNRACPSHDWSHVIRVYNLCMLIGKQEKADLFVLGLSALLHDIGRKKEMENLGHEDHAEISAELSLKIMKKYQVDEETIKKVLHCILVHRFRNNKKPESPEAEILYDADKLDSIGAIGVARAYAWAGKQGIKLYSGKDFLGTGYEKEHSPMTEFSFKLSKVKDSMQTETGKKLAENRHIFISDYFQKLKQEIKGQS